MSQVFLGLVILFDEGAEANESIHLNDAINGFRPDSKRKPRIEDFDELVHLAQFLHIRYHREEALPTDLLEAIKWYLVALDELKESDHRHLDLTTVLSELFFEHFEATKDDQWLDMSIEYTERSLERSPEDESKQSAQINHLLKASLALVQADTYTGSYDKLCKSILFLQKVLDFNGISNHAEHDPVRHDRSSILPLGGSSSVRDAQRFGQMSDRLRHDCMIISARDPTDASMLDFALEVALKSLSLLPKDQKDYVSCCLTLSKICHLMAGFKKIGIILGEYLDEAFRHASNGLMAPGFCFAEYPGFDGHCGEIFRALYESNGQWINLKKAIAFAEAAVRREGTSKSSNLGDASRLVNFLKIQYDVTHQVSVRNRVQDLGEKLAMMPEALAHHRFPAGRHAARLCVENSEFSKASKIYQLIVFMMYRILRDSLRFGERRRYLREMIGTAQEASSVALQDGEGIYAAFAVMEGGKSFILNLAISLRDDSAMVAAETPGPAAKLLKAHDDLRKIIASHGTSSTTAHSPGIPMSTIASRQQEEWRQLDDLERQIRLIPGFERFQKPVNIEDTQAALGSSIAVFLNISSFRGDAFIVSKSSAFVLSLPGFSYGSSNRGATHDRFVEHLGMLLGVNRITKSTLRNLASGNKTMLELLAWLWDVAVEPILRSLGLLDRDEQSLLPTIYCITTGWFNPFPFHAAGIHTAGSNAYTMYYAVTSYAVSVQTLIRSLSRCRGEAGGAKIRVSEDLHSLLGFAFYPWARGPWS
ncbi:MAG: hypothetical protein Q9169_005396 [Polycauliona sp. 2 TL-2023]